MKNTVLVLAVIGGLGLLGSSFLSRAQEKAVPKYEYAIVKWEGDDLLLFNMPGRLEKEHLVQQGVPIPKDAPPEEYCLTAACNRMAKDGWEPVNLDSYRIVFRRVASK
jgi:hypothetical protein